MDFSDSDEEQCFTYECQSALSVFNDSVNAVKKRIGTWRNEQEKNKSESSAIKGKLRGMEVLLKETQLELAMKSHLKEVCDAEVEKLEFLLEKAGKENTRLSSDVCRLENSVQKETEKRELLRKQVEAKTSIIDDLKSEVNESSAEKVNLISRCKSLEEKLTSRNEDFTSLVTDREKERFFAEKKLNQISAEARESAASCELLGHQVREQRKYSETLQEKLQMFQTKNTELQAKLERTTEENGQLRKLFQEEISKYKRKIERLSNDLSKEKSTRLAAEDLQTHLKHEMQGLHDKEALLETEKQNFASLHECVKDKNKELTLQLSFQKEGSEASINQLNDVIKKLQQSLQEARLEIKEKAKEIADLQKDKLLKDFEITEQRRCRNESETALKLRQECDQALHKKNELLESQLCQLRVIVSSTNRKFQKSEDADESCLIGQMVKRLNESRERYCGNKQQQQLIQNHVMQVAQLQQQLKDKTGDHRATEIEMQYMKEELERLKFHHTSLDKTRI